MTCSTWSAKRNARKKPNGPLTGGAQDPTDGTPAEAPLPPVVSDPIEGNVARKHPCDATRQRDPPSQNELVRQDPAGHDWQLLGDGDPEAGEEKYEEQADVAKLLDERNDQIAPRARFGFRKIMTSVYFDSPVRSEGALPWRSNSS